MTPDKQREKIGQRIKDGSFTTGAVIVESKYTGLRSYLNGGKITADKLYDVEQAISRLERESKA